MKLCINKKVPDGAGLCAARNFLYNRFCLHHIQQDAQIMQQRTGEDKHMPNGMHIPDILQGVEHQPRGVSHAAADEQNDSSRLHHLNQGPDGGDDAPSAGYIADHGNDLEPFDADSVEDDAENGRAPHHAEDGPANPAPQGHQSEGGVGARDQQIDGGVVKNPQHLFGLGIG